MSSMNKMPLLFAGHGSPLNAIEDNEYTKGWQEIADKIPRPDAILSISAHWYTDGTRINDAEQPKVIYDMYGFPDQLYRVKYAAPGMPALAKTAQQLISRDVQIDNSWGIDHGTWAVLCKMYPKADIPVFQLSVDKHASAEEHYQMGQELSSLREQGVLIFASGNVVHNLSQVNWNMKGGYSWATEFDGYIRNSIESGNYQEVLHYQQAGQAASQAFYQPDHFWPLLYILGAVDKTDTLFVYNDSCTLGALSMTSYLFV